jgi:hypothetical protein
MSTDDIQPSGPVGGPFRTTHWSVVLAAPGDSPQSSQALVKSLP